MKKSLSLFFLKIIALLLSFHRLAAAQTFDFSEIPKIRVYISNAPGMGHQSASVIVMRRLRQLGFQGQFQVVYNDSVANKLPTLLPGFKPSVQGPQSLPDLKIELISESQFFAQTNIEQVPFAVTGADDNRSHLTPAKLRADAYLLMEPLGWGDSYFFEGTNPPKVLTDIRSMGYYFETDTSSDSIERSLQALERDGFTEKAHGLQVLLNADAKFGAIYGVGKISIMTVKLRMWVESLAAAARSKKLDRPLILPIISPQNEYERLTLEMELKRISFPKSVRPETAIQSLDISDPQLSDRINQLKKGQILLVQVGRVPQNIFESFFEKSTLPVLVAGKNAMNLAQNLGKVYINTVHDSSLNQNTEFQAGLNLSKEAHRIFDLASNSSRDRRLMIEFFKEALDRDSELSRMHSDFGNSQNDKVARALRLIHFKELAPTCRAIFL